MSINKEKFQTNIEDFSYTKTSIDDYFTANYDLEFNNRVLTEIEVSLPQRQINDRKFLFLKNTDPLKKFTPIRMKPLQFFNLFYHEFDHIINNKPNPLSVVPRLNGIKLPFMDRFYFYSKLMEVLILNEDKYVSFIGKKIEEQYNALFDNTLGLEDNNHPKKTVNELIEALNLVFCSTGNVKEILTSLLEIKHSGEQLHPDKQINNYIQENWLHKKIEYYQDLLKNGIENIPFSIKPEIQELIDILNESEPTKQADTHLANSESTTTNEIKKEKIPAKYYALYHWILIEMGIKSHFEYDRNDKYNRKEIEKYAQHEYPETNPQGFYRAFREIDITNKKAIANNYGHGYKEKIVTISKNNAKIIEHLEKYPN